MANERLRAALLERGLTPNALAAELGVDIKTVERWVTKGREPYRKHRFAAASYPGVDEAYLWPDALTREQVAAASQSEVIAIYPHRWAVPRDIWGRLFSAASRKSKDPLLSPGRASPIQLDRSQQRQGGQRKGG